PFAAKWLERVHRHDPRRDRRRERLAVERPERNVFPLLDVARAPVVHQHHAEYVTQRRSDRNWIGERVAGPHSTRDLQLEIEPAARPELGTLRIGALRLTVRPD